MLLPTSFVLATCRKLYSKETYNITYEAYLAGVHVSLWYFSCVVEGRTLWRRKAADQRAGQL